MHAFTNPITKYFRLGRHLHEGTYRKAPTELRLHDCTYRTAGLHLQEGTYEKAPTGRHLDASHRRGIVLDASRGMELHQHARLSAWNCTRASRRCGIAPGCESSERHLQEVISKFYETHMFRCIYICLNPITTYFRFCRVSHIRPLHPEVGCK